MEIVERKSEYIDENGKKHKYIEVVQVNEDGSEEIRATIDTELSDKQSQPESIEPANNVYDEVRSVIANGIYTKEDLLNKIDTLFIMNRLTTEQYKELSRMIN